MTTRSGVDIRTVDLTRLSFGVLKGACADAKKQKLLPADTKCNVTKDGLLDIMQGLQRRLNPQAHVARPTVAAPAPAPANVAAGQSRSRQRRPAAATDVSAASTEGVEPALAIMQGLGRQLAAERQGGKSVPTQSPPKARSVVTHTSPPKAKVSTILPPPPPSGLPTPTRSPPRVVNLPGDAASESVPVKKKVAKRRESTPHVPTTQPISFLNADVLGVIMQYVDYSQMLALVAAYPVTQLVRPLYHHHSIFWHQRLGAQTGRGCLVTSMENNALAVDSPWSTKTQHDALLPRPGYLIISIPVGKVNVMVATARRVKAVVDSSAEVDILVNGHQRKAYRIHILALWEDGSLCELMHEVPTRRITDHDVATIKAAIEGDDLWHHIKAAVPRPIKTMTLPKGKTAPLPRMRMMINSGRRLVDWTVCLDYEGNVWAGRFGMPEGSQAGTPDSHLALSQVSYPDMLGADGELFIVSHIAHVSSSRISHGVPPISSNSLHSEQLVVASLYDGRQYLLHLGERTMGYPLPPDPADSPGTKRVATLNVAVPVYYSLSTLSASDLVVDHPIMAPDVANVYPPLGRDSIVVGDLKGVSDQVTAIIPYRNYREATYLTPQVVVALYTSQSVLLRMYPTPDDNKQSRRVAGKIAYPVVMDDRVSAPLPSGATTTEVVDMVASMNEIDSVKADSSTRTLGWYQVFILPKWTLGAIDAHSVGTINLREIEGSRLHTRSTKFRKYAGIAPFKGYVVSPDGGLAHVDIRTLPDWNGVHKITYTDIPLTNIGGSVDEGSVGEDIGVVAERIVTKPSKSKGKKTKDATPIPQVIGAMVQLNVGEQEEKMVRGIGV